MIANAPFVKVLVPFMFGILLFSMAPNSFYWLWTIIVTSILLAGLWIFHRQKDVFRVKYANLKGIILLSSWLVFGYALSGVKHLPFDSNWYGNNFSNTSFYKGTILNMPEEKEKTLKIDIALESKLEEGKNKSIKGKSILYLKKGTQASALKEGQQIVFRNKLAPVMATKNPGAFDYAAYCRRQGVYHTGFLQDADWAITSENVKKSWRSITTYGTEFVKRILRKYIRGEEELGIAEALLIGYRLDIDQNLWQAYSNTGIVHIIAISGMHMAMIYQSLLWLLTCIPYFKKNRKSAVIISLVFMWLFAILTGLPASVVRSAVMFTFIGIGDVLKKKMTIYNNMAASAFLLLCINPNWLFDVGFQLSYLAVLSIVMFYKWIYDKFSFKNRVSDFFWKLVAGTLSAQILTFPICIYYFHQFPVLFLVMNLIAIPITTVVLFAEILLIFLSWIPMVASLLGYLSYFLIHYLNKIVFYIEKLSFAVWQYLSINLWQLALLYLLIGFTTYFIQTRKTYLSHLAYFAAIFFVCIAVYNKYLHLTQNKIAILNNGTNTTVAYVHGTKYHLFSKDTITPKQRQYVINPMKIEWQLNEINHTIVNHFSNPSFHASALGNHFVLALLDNQIKCTEPVRTDILIVGGKNPISSDSLIKNFKFKKLILDASIPFWKMDNYKASLENVGLSFHSISKDGAFIIDL